MPADAAHASENLVGNRSAIDVEGPDAAQVLVEAHGPLTVIHLHQPAKRNAVSLRMRSELRSALQDLPSTTRAVVLTGSASYFSSGGDLTEQPTAEHEARRFEHLTAIADWIIAGPVPVIAAVEGGAHGVGLSFVAASDYVVSARDASFRAPFVRVGLTGDGGLTWSLPRRIGLARARAMMLSAIAVTADRAFETGLVDELVAPGTALERAVAVAREWATGSPTAIASTKAALADDVISHLGALEREALLQRELQGGPDFHEARRAFQERRTPQFLEAGPRP